MRYFRRKFLGEAQTDGKGISFGERLHEIVRKLGLWLFLLFCAVAAAVLIKASYPQASHYIVAWVALAPFIIGIMRFKKLWSAFLYSWFTAVLVYGGVFWWVYRTCREGGGMTPMQAAGAWLGLSALIGIQFALWGGSCFFLKKLKGLFPLLAACGFVALEWLHQTIAFYGLGFPWFMMGYSQWNFPPALQVASLGGVYAVSFALVFTGVSVGYAFSGKAGFKGGVFQLILAGLVFGGVCGYGRWQLNRTEPQALLSLKHAVIQPNIDQYKKWTPEFETEILSVLQTQADDLKNRHLTLAVWPESAVPGFLTEEPYLGLFTQAARDSGSYMVVGSNLEEEGKPFVGAYVISPFEEAPQSYRKIKLVPFGEYIPLEGLVRRVAKEVEVLGELGSFLPGPFQQPLLQAASIPFGITICYESIFPQLWWRQTRAGAKFFVNVTNDAWFFNSDAPYQHLAVNVLRAVETGRPVLRSANTGISAVIDRHGRILQSAPLNTRAVLEESVPLPITEAKNFYTQWGDWLAWLCAVLYFTLLISTFVFAYE